MAKIQITEQDVLYMASAILESLENEIQDNEETNLDESEKFMNMSRKHKGHKPQWQGMHDKSRNRNTARQNIKDWLTNPELDCAEIARQLWPHKSEESRRSYFYKCRDNKTYTAGKKKRRYDFTNLEYHKLYSIMKSATYA